MGPLRGTLPVCSVDHHCSEWARTYLKFCVCNTKDIVSLSLGMLSVLSWGVAEVPQIITNYKEKSTEGLSVIFLMTWIIGDLFNLIGCLLEPATLPTQYYMAVLYTATTVILTAQTVYYGHIYPRLKANKTSLLCKNDIHNQEDKLANQNMTGYNILAKNTETGGYQEDGSSTAIASSPIPVLSSSRRYSSSGRDLYYMSARSLSKSPLPTAGLWLAHSRESGRTIPIITDNQQSSRQPLLDGLSHTQSEAHINTKSTLSVVTSAAFFLGIYVIHLSTNNAFHASSPGMVILVNRRLLQDKIVESSMREGSGSSEIGSYLGWAMTAIYLGGRLPQICLNIRRGNAQGLNPLMFMFALFGNLTYVGSILVKSLEWSRIKPNLPWLVDAGGCVLLDAFILIQFAYFRYWKPKNSRSTNDHHDKD